VLYLLRTTPWTFMGSGGIAPRFLTSILDGGEWSASRPDRFVSEERARSIHWKGGWIRPRASLVIMENRIISSLCRESFPVPHSLAYRCSDWAKWIVLTLLTEVAHPVILISLVTSIKRRIWTAKVKTMESTCECTSGKIKRNTE
jgi:hypothetical protein